METESYNRYLALFDEPNQPVPPPSTALVHNLVRERAEAHPFAEAVVCWDGTLSYKELDSSSSQLAGFLASKGIGLEDVVPLLFEKSSWAVVAMLAVMKAGGAFMTLDASQPVSRLRSVVTESGAKIALCSAHCFELCTSLLPAAVAVTEKTMAGLRTSLETWPAGLGNAAYVMATSGSTGLPKLVVTEHAQLSSFVAHFTRPLGFREDTRAFQFASYAFDPVIGDTFLSLAAGGTVCIPSEHERKSDIVGAMNRMKVTLAKFTPSLVNSMPDLTSTNVPTLKALVLGGESASDAVVRAWSNEVDLKLIYGSTECTMSFVVPNAAMGVEHGEIGEPVGSRAWVIKTNASGDPAFASNGEVGELFVGGPLVARGYLNDPSQTKAKFFEGSKQRVYRTGDLVRRLENGRLVYVGRVDNQVKIRGQRIELEEVEQHVRQSLHYPDVGIKNVLIDAAVPMGATSIQLVAFLSLTADKSFGSLVCREVENDGTLTMSPETRHNFASVVAQLERNLRLAVPSYMVPSLWIPIDEMPYTMSRKRDRQRLRQAIEGLPALDLALFARNEDNLGQGDDSMITEEGEMLRRLWADVLGLSPVSIQSRDNFFHLGGHSLLAMRLVALVRRQGYRLTVDQIFTHPVLQDLAAKLTPAVDSIDIAPFALIERSSVATIQKEAAEQCHIHLSSIEDIFPLYSMQEHYVLNYPERGQEMAGPWDWQQQIVFELPEFLDQSLFKRVWKDAIQRHTQLRTRIVQTSRGIFQAVLSNDVSPTWRNSDSLEEYCEQDRNNHMSFGDELLRLAIVASTEKQCFVLTLQHLIYDAYCRDLLFKELEAAYLHQTVRANPPKINQFINYINGADRQLAADFWTRYLKGSSTKALLSKPVGSPLSELTNRLLTIKKPQLPQLDYTLATIIETSVALAIAQILDCRDVIFYSDRAGRNLPVDGIQELMAPTTLFLPLRVDVDQRQPIQELLSDHQRGKKESMPYEYLAWTELRQMDHLKDVLQHSINLNINPYTPLEKLGAGMGLKMLYDHESWGDPFTVDVSVRETEISIVVHYDPSFITGDMVGALTEKIGKAFEIVSKSHQTPTRSVGDLLAILR